MATVVAGFATSFSPQLHVPPDLWPTMGEQDRRSPGFLAPDGQTKSFDDLLANVSPDVARGFEPDERASRHRRCQDHIATISQRIKQANLDALIILTHEDGRFDDEQFPAFFVYCGETVPYFPPTVAENASAPARAAAWGFGQQSWELPGTPELGTAVIQHLAKAGFDVSLSTRFKPGVGVGHNIGFVYTRLLAGTSLPIMPVLCNVGIPPNVPTLSRFYGIGQAITDAVNSSSANARVGILAVGGLSHALINEQLDRRLLDACIANDERALCSLPDDQLYGGNGQFRLWVAASGGLRGLQMTLLDYIPAYRSAAGTGCGMAFAYWDQP